MDAQIYLTIGHYNNRHKETQILVLTWILITNKDTTWVI